MKYPKIKVKLTGNDGNAFVVLGKVRQALKRGKVSQEEIDEFLAEAMSSNYDHLLRTCMEWVDVSLVAHLHGMGGRVMKKRTVSRPVEDGPLRCGNCTYYKMIDSGYGDCYGMPPQAGERTIVAWCDPSCSIFMKELRRN